MIARTVDGVMTGRMSLAEPVPVMRTPDEWCCLLGISILDPDGWRGKDGRDYSDPVTAEEYDRRVWQCTLMAAPMPFPSAVAFETKPPRIPEPGRWGVVEASIIGDLDARHFVRDATDGNADWTSMWGGDRYDWANLIEPVLVREGIES